MPSIVQVHSSQDTAEDVTQTFEYAPSPTSGNLLVLASAVDATGGTEPLTDPSGFTRILVHRNAPSGILIAVWHKVSDGTETGTGTFTTSDAQRAAHVMFEIADAEDPATQAPEASTPAEGFSTAPDPASLSPTGGSKAYLWLALAAMDRGDSAATGFPTGYSNTGSEGTTSTASAGATIAWATRELETASEDPSAFTIPQEGFVAVTIAVHPGAGGGGGGSTQPSRSMHQYRLRRAA